MGLAKAALVARARARSLAPRVALARARAPDAAPSFPSLTPPPPPRYSLYDPSYSNPESFGFFIDVGNGFSTLLPTLAVPLASALGLAPERRLPFFCVALAVNWQMFYGTLVYFLSFFYNGRHKGRGWKEVAGFVGVSNALWLIGPAAGMYASYEVIRTGEMTVLRGEGG